jgi:hypothetical protein
MRNMIIPAFAVLFLMHTLETRQEHYPGLSISRMSFPQEISDIRPQENSQPPLSTMVEARYLQAD